MRNVKNCNWYDGFRALATQRSNLAQMGRYALALASAGFALLAISIFAREYQSYFAAAGLQPMNYVLSENPFPVAPLGLNSHENEIELCFKARSALDRSVLKAEAKAEGYKTCLDLAEQVLRVMPSYGPAWQLRGEMQLSLWELDKGAANPAALDAAVASQLAAAAAAPNTVWLMQRRLRFALDLPAQVMQDNMISKLVAADVPKLLSLAETRRWLANLYLRNANLRQIVQGLDESRVSADDLSKFISLVRNASRQNSTEQDRRQGERSGAP